jgi:hypothetical protein
MTMARRSPQKSDDSCSSVAEQAMPGWKAVNETSLEESGSDGTRYAADTAGDDVVGTADSVMPSMEELKAKYLGAARADALPMSREAAADAADTTLVELEAGPLKKTVAVSKSKKKVIWSQG